MKHLATKFDISSTSMQSAGEHNIQYAKCMISFFTVIFMFEMMVMCKVKHFFPLSTCMELKLCDTFGMLLHVYTWRL